ncbi:MAG: hypothetical protein M3Q55_11715 [Acidobacteriota bacterium]|nr:hypothetical protein [Acidobacteriota bacterium]
MRKLLVLWAAMFLAAHLPYLPPSLGDLDSINFALAVREFDVAAAQPHAPGFPLYVGLTRLATAGLFAAGDPLNAPRALALVNVLGAALALVALFGLARALDYPPRRALAATIVIGTIPLYWFSAARPLSDLLALALAAGAQALLARAWIKGGRWQATAGALLAGAAAGLGFLTLALTLPLVIAVLLSRGERHTRLLAAFGLVDGLATWVVPLVIDAGAPATWRMLGEYVRAGIDVTGTLASAPSLSRAVAALSETFVDPFGHPVLAAAVLTGAAVGVVIAAAREPVVLRTLALAYLPYAAVVLLLQDTLVARLAVPLLVPIAMLFVVPFAYLSTRAVLPAAAGAATAGLFIVFPAMQTYAYSESPGVALVRELHRLPRVQETVLGMHRRVADEIARHQSWEAIPPMRTLPSPVDYEWYELAKLWQEGYDGPIWFLADPSRTDLRLIDPQQRTLLRQYGWASRELPYLRGSRPDRIDWHFIQRPGWFLGRGWALSPEIGGLTMRDRMAPGQQPAVAWVRRRDVPVTMALGGRHLGSASDPPLVLRVSVDGRKVDEWPIAPGPFLFMRPVLPEELAGDQTYARLELSATWAGSGPAPISLEQFDFQSIDGAMVAFDRGWWEPEYDRRTGQTWRWTSREATLWLYNPGRDLTLSIAGEGPGRYYSTDTEMTVFAGDREIGRFQLHGDFTHTMTVPVEPLSVARGRVTLRFSQSHVPNQLTGSPDQRELGVRIYDVKVH